MEHRFFWQTALFGNKVCPIAFSAKQKSAKVISQKNINSVNSECSKKDANSTHFFKKTVASKQLQILNMKKETLLVIFGEMYFSRFSSKKGKKEKDGKQIMEAERVREKKRKKKIDISTHSTFPWQRKKKRNSPPLSFPYFWHFNYSGFCRRCSFSFVWVKTPIFPLLLSTAHFGASPSKNGEGGGKQTLFFFDLP